MNELEGPPHYLYDLCNFFDLRPASLYSDLLLFISKLKGDKETIETVNIVRYLKMGNFNFSPAKMKGYLKDLENKGLLREQSPESFTITKLIPSYDEMKELEEGTKTYTFSIDYSKGKRHIHFNIGDTLSPKPKKKMPQEEIIKKTIEYLNSQTNKNFKYQTHATKKLIAGRLREGNTFSDFKRVIDNKVSEWAYDPEMAKYLRPATLFSPSKFEAYLNENDSTGPLEENHQDKIRETFREALRQKIKQDTKS